MYVHHPKSTLLTFEPLYPFLPHPYSLFPRNHCIVVCAYDKQIFTGSREPGVLDEFSCWHLTTCMNLSKSVSFVKEGVGMHSRLILMGSWWRVSDSGYLLLFGLPCSLLTLFEEGQLVLLPAPSSEGDVHLVCTLGDSQRFLSGTLNIQAAIDKDS